MRQWRRFYGRGIKKVVLRDISKKRDFFKKSRFWPSIDNDNYLHPLLAGNYDGSTNCFLL